MENLAGPAFAYQIVTSLVTPTHRRTELLKCLLPSTPEFAHLDLDYYFKYTPKGDGDHLLSAPERLRSSIYYRG